MFDKKKQINLTRLSKKQKSEKQMYMKTILGIETTKETIKQKSRDNAARITIYETASNFTRWKIAPIV